MKKNIKKILAAVLLLVILAMSNGCSQQKDYGEEYNYETDYQYSYVNNFSWRNVQSDGDGQYIFKNSYIYYYNTEKKTMTPLCNKANCLHDMETDEERLSDCNAYVPSNSTGYIQYYDGYVYYVSSDILTESLYRVSKDGSKKDKIFTTDEYLIITEWLIHRGYFYYVLQTYQIGSGDDTYSKQFLKSVELSSDMSDKNAKVIFEGDDKNKYINLSDLKAYKNYFYYDTTGDGKYLYNIETEQTGEITVPEVYDDTVSVNQVVFMEDKILLGLGDGSKTHIYDNLEDNMQIGRYKLPVYSVNYDLTDAKIWLDGKEQSKLMHPYGDYVIISDAFLLYLPYLYTSTTVSDGDLPFSLDELPRLCNIEIYSSDGECVSYFKYPIRGNGLVATFNGFGPDGVNVEFEENENSWSVYELNFKDVLDCRGEEVKLDLVSTRKFGALNKEDY